MPWHKIKDELPEEYHDVLLYEKGDTRDMVVGCPILVEWKNGVLWELPGEYHDFEPTHWHELPEPPKEDQ